MRHLISTTISLVVVPGILAGTVPLVDMGRTADDVGPETVAQAVGHPVVELVDGPVTASLRDLQVVATSDDERRTVLRSVGLYEQAGLQLPPLEVRIGTIDGCDGHVAVHRHRDGLSEIELCATGATGLEHILLHELAHAWVEHHLSDEGRQRFQDVRGWERWNDHADAWRDRGTEQAAEVIKWGVNDRVAPILVDHGGCEDLADSYRILTGVDPLQPRTVACDPPSMTEAR